jgi:hypothetical protein
MRLAVYMEGKRFAEKEFGKIIKNNYKTLFSLTTKNIKK